MVLSNNSKQFQSLEVYTYDLLKDCNMWVSKSRRTGYNTNTELVKQVQHVQLHVVKVRWLFNLAMSAFPPLCYKSSLTSSCWQPKPQLHVQCSPWDTVPTRNHWGCWCPQTPGDICMSTRPRGKTILGSWSSTHKRGRGSLGQTEIASVWWPELER